MVSKHLLLHSCGSTTAPDGILQAITLHQGPAHFHPARSVLNPHTAVLTRALLLRTQLSPAARPSPLLAGKVGFPNL